MYILRKNIYINLNMLWHLGKENMYEPPKPWLTKFFLSDAIKIPFTHDNWML